MFTGMCRVMKVAVSVINIEWRECFRCIRRVKLFIGSCTWNKEKKVIFIYLRIAVFVHPFIFTLSFILGTGEYFCRLPLVNQIFWGNKKKDGGSVSRRHLFYILFFLSYISRSLPSPYFSHDSRSPTRLPLFTFAAHWSVSPQQSSVKSGNSPQQHQQEGAEATLNTVRRCPSIRVQVTEPWIVVLRGAGHTARRPPPLSSACRPQYSPFTY